MKKLLCTILLFSGISLVPSLSLAWSGAGHMVIAGEAYRELSQETKGKVDLILKSHPEYKKWEKSFKPDGSSLDLSTFVFMKAGVWPDEIRRKGGATKSYDHPHWHYVDYPLKPTKFPMEPGPSPKDDALYGIAQSEKILSDAKSTPEEKAVYLAWLIHLVGDLHQPLHCSSLFTDAYPTGDKGGNDFYVKPASRGVKLHSLWDGLLGTSQNPRSQMNYAIEIKAAYPRKSLPELTKSKTPKEWSLEGRTLAIEKGYLRGALEGSTTAENAPALPYDYTKQAKVVAEKQGALAGYRLADEVQKLIK